MVLSHLFGVKWFYLICLESKGSCLNFSQWHCSTAEVASRRPTAWSFKMDAQRCTQTGLGLLMGWPLDHDWSISTQNIGPHPFLQFSVTRTANKIGKGWARRCVDPTQAGRGRRKKKGGLSNFYWLVQCVVCWDREGPTVETDRSTPIAAITITACDSFIRQLWRAFFFRLSACN